MRDFAYAEDNTLGAGSMEKSSVMIESISTAVPALDVALGIGGLPVGRIVEVFGQPNTGKTTLALHLIAAVQNADGVAAYIDLDQRLDPNYLKEIVNYTNLLVSQPDDTEKALEIIEGLARSGAVNLIVVDSLAGLTPRSELEGRMGDADVGLQARLMSQALRTLTATVHRTGCLVVFINQVRQKIGVTFGNGEVTTGGNALKFYSSVRIEAKFLRQEGDTKAIEFLVRKNKLAPPFTTCIVALRPDEGFCEEIKNETIVTVVIDYFTRNGHWVAKGSSDVTIYRFSSDVRSVSAAYAHVAYKWTLGSSAGFLEDAGISYALMTCGEAAPRLLMPPPRDGVGT